MSGRNEKNFQELITRIRQDSLLRLNVEFHPRVYSKAGWQQNTHNCVVTWVRKPESSLHLFPITSIKVKKEKNTIQPQYSNIKTLSLGIKLDHYSYNRICMYIRNNIWSHVTTRTTMTCVVLRPSRVRVNQVLGGTQQLLTLSHARRSRPREVEGVKQQQINQTIVQVQWF